MLFEFQITVFLGDGTKLNFCGEAVPASHETNDAFFRDMPKQFLAFYQGVSDSFSWWHVNGARQSIRVNHDYVACIYCEHRLLVENGDAIVLQMEEASKND